jgi:hypothetical protein
MLSCLSRDLRLCFGTQCQQPCPSCSSVFFGREFSSPLRSHMAKGRMCLLKEALLPGASLAGRPRKLFTTSLWSTEWKWSGNFYVPTDWVGSTRCRFKFTKALTGLLPGLQWSWRKAGCMPGFLQSMALDVCHWYPLKLRLQKPLPPPPKSRDDLCKMPYFWGQLDPFQMSVQIRKCFLKAECIHHG